MSTVGTGAGPAADRGYYRAFMSAAPAAGDAQAIDRKLAVRSGRQERLTSDDAPEVWAVLNEAGIAARSAGPR